MTTAKAKTNEIDEYISGFPEDTQKYLQELRQIIMKAAPDAEEVISYKMPAYQLHGILVYFAGYKSHIGFYPTSTGIAAFKESLSVFKSAKGSVQFPLDKPLPAHLITEIVAFRVKENLERQATKNKKTPVKRSRLSSETEKEKEKAKKSITVKRSVASKD